MKKIKNVLSVISEPFMSIANGVNADKIVKFFNHHKFMIYVVAIILTAILMSLAYFTDVFGIRS